MMNRKTILGSSLLLAVLVTGAVAWWYASSAGRSDEKSLLLYGNVDIREIDLAFYNTEHIERILVQEGDTVREGQLLATLHKERVQAGYAAAEAKVASQKAVLARLEAGSRPEEIRQAKADVAAARAKLVDTEVTYRRIRRLFDQQAASQQAADDAEASLETARANLEVAEQELALAIEGPRSEDIEEARAMLRADEARLALAAAVLKDTELHAPDDGIVRNRILEPGDMASPQTPVLTLALTNPVWVRAYAPETVLGKLAPGMIAEASTDSYPDKTYRGWLGYISPTAEFTPKNVETPELRTRLVYQVRIYVCNPENELRLGMPATVSIPLDRPKPDAGHAIPDCAIQEKG